jgi:hypothetical protein
LLNGLEALACAGLFAQLAGSNYSEGRVQKNRPAACRKTKQPIVLLVNRPKLQQNTTDRPTHPRMEALLRAGSTPTTFPAPAFFRPLISALHTPHSVGKKRAEFWPCSAGDHPPRCEYRWLLRRNRWRSWRAPGQACTRSPRRSSSIDAPRTPLAGRSRAGRLRSVTDDRQRTRTAKLAPVSQLARVRSDGAVPEHIFRRPHLIKLFS